MRRLFSGVNTLLVLFFFSLPTFPASIGLVEEPGLSSRTTRLAVMSDPHYLSSKLVKEGDALTMYEESTGRRVVDLHQVLEKVLTDFLMEDVEVLLISGDLTNHGERQSHLDFREILRSLQERGMQILVIPGNHDVNIPNAKAYVGAKPIPTEGISKEEFADIYAHFGYRNALERDEASLSYVASIDDNTWLLAFDTNRYDEHTHTPITAGRIRSETMEWALDQLDKAKEKEITVLGMMHHGLVEHMPYQSDLFSAYLVENWERDANRLAEAGLKVVFTGHFHSNDVSKHTSPTGYSIYDVETASLAQYPFAYRIIELAENKLSIDTRFVISVPNNPNLEEEYRDRMVKLARRVALGRLKGFGIRMPEETREAIVEVVAQLSVMHARGDEVLDDEMEDAIRNFAKLLGGEADLDSFAFDFPPEDNRLVIYLKGDR